MRRVKRPKLGERVLLTRWSDGDKHDPWFIGFLCEIGEDDHKGMFYRAKDDEGKKSGYYRYCRRITLDESIQWFKDAEAMGLVNTYWRLSKMAMDPMNITDEERRLWELSEKQADELYHKDKRISELEEALRCIAERLNKPPAKITREDAANAWFHATVALEQPEWETDE